MRRGFAVLALVGVFAATASGATAARLDEYPPTNYRPVWSPDGTTLAFEAYDPGSARRQLRVVARDGSGVRTLPVPPGVFSPDWFWVLVDEPPSRIVRPGKQDERKVPVVPFGAWAPDSKRIAFTVDQPGVGTSIHVLDIESGFMQHLTSQASNPQWSPDGLRIAFVNTAQPLSGESDLGVVNADGTNRRLIAAPNIEGWQASGLAWSPDSSTLAIQSPNASGWRLWLVDVGGDERRSFHGWGNMGQLDWTPDGRSVVYAGLDGIWRVDTRRGTAFRVAQSGTDVHVAPDGREVAFTGWGDCDRRTGIYRVATAGGRPVRLTNDCRIDGTAGADTVRGTQHADVLAGGDGEDTLVAVADYYWEGDVLSGGSGNDRLVGSAAADVLRGGPGRDRIEARGARDIVFAADGAIDVVSCGTHPTTDVERDIAYADRLDRVAGDCEYVYRRGVPPRDTRLVLRVWPTALDVVRPPGRPVGGRRFTLSCTPARGSLPDAAAVCRRLAVVDPFLRAGPEAVCGRRAAKRGVAHVSGRYGGRPVNVYLLRRDACEKTRWDALGIGRILQP